jgi:hypothetical protein
MRNKWIIALTSLIFSALLTPLNAADDKPDFADPYVPQIKSLSLSYEQKKVNSQYIVETSFNLVVRVHRNPLSSFSISFVGPNSSITAPCQDLTSSLSYGNLYAKQGEFKVPPGLVSRVQDGDWYEEKHLFKISNTTAWPPVNLIFAPCLGEAAASFIQMKDLAGHGVSINNVGPYVKQPTQQNSNDLPLDADQRKCEILYPDKVSSPCTHNIQWENLTMTFSGTQDKSISQIQVIDYQFLNTELRNQVTFLSTEKTTLSGQITKLTSEKLLLQGQLSASNAEKSTLSGQVSTLTTANSALTSNAANLNGKLSAANKKITAICKAKPKPKGC